MIETSGEIDGADGRSDRHANALFIPKHGTGELDRTSFFDGP
jgi:hypothetical protein